MILTALLQPSDKKREKLRLALGPSEEVNIRTKMLWS